MAGPDHLGRFLDAQARDYSQAVRELRAGRKTSHWIWFVFPQLKGLGRSATAEHFGIASLAEARDYLSHPVLGPRLRECAGLLLAVAAPRPIEAIVGAVDALKVWSSMTLFSAATEDNAEFRAVLDRFYGGDSDPLTLALLDAR